MKSLKTKLIFSTVAATTGIAIFSSLLLVYLTNTFSDIGKNTHILFIASGIIIGSCILAFLVALRLSKILIQPIINSSERLRSLSEGNLSDPVKTVKANDELGVLTTSLEETVNNLNAYVKTITETLVNISDGNLTERVHGTFRGDFIKIKSTFNTILASLIDTFGNINSAAEQVNSGANQVSNGAQALSQGATEQASSIEELSATIADVSHQITSNAKDAKTAEAIVEQNTVKISSCNDDMINMLKSMEEIKASSNEISKIIKVIDDIAFQTNILALNAAVEAARAGSAGKGFAVVADEVRSLAAKSAEAAKQTTALIEGSIKTVARGSSIAKETADALNDVVEGTKQINKLVKDISKASEYQAESIVQINAGIDQISGVVQTNTATAQESAAASEELSGQSLLLKNMISKFKLGDKEKLFGKASTSFGGSSFGKSEFSFDNSPSTGFNFESAPASEFKFESAPSSGFNFESAPTSEFKFESAPDDEPASEFSFGSFGSSEPKEDFAFGSDANEPLEEFKFSGSFGDDLKINLDDEDSKY